MDTVIGAMSDSCPDPGVVTANISARWKHKYILSTVFV